MNKGDSKRCDSMKGAETSKVVHEGWMVRCGRRKIGRSYIHMRYFVLETTLLAYYKRKPQDDMVPLKTLVIDGNCRVEDRGLKTHHGHTVYVLCICNKKEEHQRMTMAAFNIQDALSWKEKIELVIDREIFSAHGKSLASFKSGVGIQLNSFDPESQGSPEEDENHPALVRRTTIGNGPPPIFDWTQLESGLSNQNNDDHTSSQKYWHLIRCQNGLRIFEELPQVDNLPRSCSKSMKAVGIVEATCEEIFERVMCMDETRFEWDCSFQYGCLVEEVDGHTAILYHQLQLEWFPLCVWPRDLCYVRYWRRHDNGNYVVLFRSREHSSCGPRPGFVRAHIESGGFNISPQKPQNGRPRCKVQHLMQIDLKGWVVGNIPSFQQHCLIRMLSSVAGLREWFSQTDVIPRVSHIPVIAEMVSGPLSLKKDQKFQETALRSSPSVNHRRNLSKNYIMFDEDSDVDEDFQIHELDMEAPSSKSETDKQTGLEEDSQAQIDFSCFSGNLHKDELGTGRNCWRISEGKNFKVRSKNFTFDKKSKVPAGKHLMELVAVDWFKDSKRMDHVARRPGCAAQVASEQGLFSLVINLQIPGSTNYSMIFYFVVGRLVRGSLLQQFFDGNDEFRNSRIKLIPAVPKGSWIVRQSVGNAACLLGKAVDCNYIRRPNYLEIDVDIGSSTVANGVLGLVLGVVTTLVVDMAFLIQANTIEELPEQLLGAVRISQIELSSAVVPVLDSITCAS